MKENILVLGGSGFLGSHLVESLHSQGYEIRCLVRRTSDISLLKSKAEIIYGDVFEEESIRKALSGTEVVYNLVGGGNVSTVTEKGLETLRRLNAGSVESLLSIAKDFPLKKIIHFSSISAMGIHKNETLSEEGECKPKIPHEIAKYESEKVAMQYFREYGLPVVILRPPQIYGPGDVKSEILKLVKYAKRFYVPLIGGGKSYMPWVYVEDVVQGAVKAMTHGRIGEVYIISDKQSYKFRDIIAEIAKALDTKLRTIYIPKSFAKISVSLLEPMAKLLGKEPILSRYRIGSMTSDRFVSINKARSELNYEPLIPLSEGMKLTVNWYVENGFV